LLEDRNGMIVDVLLTHADGMAERDAALILMHRQYERNRKEGRTNALTLGADKAYDTRDFVNTLHELNVRAHVARNTRRIGGSAIDNRTSRHASYAVSQRKRPLIEKVFGWMKQTGGMRKTKLRGLLKVSWQFLMTAAAFNLWRLPKLPAVV
jgi:hypothetical protein